MNRHGSASFLQLQLGQEVIYLLLSVFALIALVLALFVTSERARSERLEKEVAEGQNALARVSTLEAKNSELQNALHRLNADSATPTVLNQRLAELENAHEGDKKAIAARDDELRRIKAEIDGLASAIARNESEREKILAQLTDRPPIINLSEAKGYLFRTGDSSLTEDFRKKMTDLVIPTLIEQGQRYRADVIEVIGHTDEVRVPERYSNLDTRLVAFLRGEGGEGMLVAGDNTGLGMSRAASVVRYLMADPRLLELGYTVLPLSGGQAVNTSDRLSAGGEGKDAQERRRIEIRLRRR